MYFVVNDEHIDITGQISEIEPFTYDYQDEQGNTHYWIVGLNDDEHLNNFGYAEFIRSADGEWMGGYSARTNIGPDGEPEQDWFRNGKKAINAPW